jgi:hypothetical protein
MRETLREELLVLRVLSYEAREDFSAGRCDIHMNVSESTREGEVLSIDGVGVGLVDAAFVGLKARFAPEYQSLESIAFSAFQVKGIMSSGRAAATDAEARVEIGIRNSYGSEFRFEFQSRSLGHACIQAVAEGLQYFMNSERAFVRMYKARDYYQKEGRVDLVTKYTANMAKMVENTSYTEIIDRVRSELE